MNWTKQQQKKDNATKDGREFQRVKHTASEQLHITHTGFGGCCFFLCGYLDKCKLFQDLMFLIVKYTTTKPRHVLTLSGKKKKKSYSLKHSSLSSGWNISYRAQHKAQSGFGPDTEHKSVPGSGVCESSSYWTKSQHDIWVTFSYPTLQAAILLHLTRMVQLIRSHIIHYNGTLVFK